MTESKSDFPLSFSFSFEFPEVFVFALFIKVIWTFPRNLLIHTFGIWDFEDFLEYDLIAPRGR